VVAISHPLVGEHGLYTSAIKLGIAPGRIDRTAPCLGEHNDRVFIHYMRLLGLSSRSTSRFAPTGSYADRISTVFRLLRRVRSAIIET